MLQSFGSPRDRLEKTRAALRAGKGILVVDSEQRENEGDLVFPAESLTVGQVALMIRECSGIICLCLPPSKVHSLNLEPMARENTSAYQTAFTVSIEAARGVTTGVSAADRLVTIQTAIADNATPHDLNRPGHVFPLCAREGGVLVRPGHTEATVDLMRLAGLKPYGVLCELTNPDGTMARLPEIATFARRHAIPVVTIDDIIAYRRRT